MSRLTRFLAPDLPDAAPPGAVRVAGVQMEPRVTENTRNLESVVEMLRSCREEGAALAVFPECALTGYCFADAAEATRFAVRRDGPEIAAIAASCADLGLFAVVGYLERLESGIANAASLIGPRGIVGHYQKSHLPYLGVDRWVEAGAAPLQPVEAAGLRTGVLICYDASFPEATRTLALRGADLVVLPTNWPHEAVLKAEWLPNARAYENVIYFAAINRVGTERGYAFHGRSRFCGPTGETLVQGPDDEPALLVVDVFPERARTKKIQRRGEEYWVDRIGHRRPDLYEV